MDIKKAFDEGRFPDIINSEDTITSSEDKLMLGISFFKLGKDRQALKIFNELSDEVRQLVKVFYFMATIYKQSGDLPKANCHLQQYLAFYPDDDEAFDLLNAPDAFVTAPSVELARIYAQQGHYEQALDIFVKLLMGDDEDSEMKKEAEKIQNIFITKTLEKWLERLKK